LDNVGRRVTRTQNARLCNRQGATLSQSSDIHRPIAIPNPITKHAKLSSPFSNSICTLHNHTNIPPFRRIKVENEGYARNDLAAWACIRLDRLQTGYRFIKLFDAKGIATNGILLVRIEKTVVGIEEKSLLTRSAKLSKIESQA
jgi:hypothetical protein